MERTPIPYDEFIEIRIERCMERAMVVHCKSGCSRRRAERAVQEATFYSLYRQQLLKESARNRAAGKVAEHDLVYCAGLFDYLSDNVCKLLVEILWGMVAPGGLLIVTNVDRHPTRAQMECFLEWNLVYRNSQDMRRLAPASVPFEDVVLKRDETGVNIFLELRKPEHGG